MSRVPSTSTRYDPSPRAMKTGSPPTARKARTGLFTPPGKRFFARASSRCDRCDLMAGGSTTTNPSRRGHVARAALVRRSSARVAGKVIEDGGDVLRVDRPAHREAPLGALHRERHHLGRIVLAERLGELLDGVGVVAELDQAVARLEARLGLLARSHELLGDFPVGRDGFRMAAGKMEGGSGEQRGWR